MKSTIYFVCFTYTAKRVIGKGIVTKVETLCRTKKEAQARYAEKKAHSCCSNITIETYERTGVTR